MQATGNAVAETTYYSRSGDGTKGYTYSRVAVTTGESVSDYYVLRGGVAYTISSTSPWYSKVNEYANEADSGLTLTATSNDETTFTVTYDESKFNAANFANTLKTWLDGLSDSTTPTKSQITVADSKTASGTQNGTTTATVSLNVSTSGAGYYLVDTSLGSLVSLDTASRTVDMYEKNNTPSVVKDVSDDGTTWAQRPSEGDPSVNANVGDTVFFKLTVNSGTGADSAITVHDKMDDGLTLNPNSFAITINNDTVNTSNYTIKVNTSAKKTAAIPETVTSDALTDNDTFEIEFKENFVKNKTALPNNTNIVITYNAILNSSAKQYYDETTTNDNASHLTYENQTTVDSKVKVKTYQFRLNKVDQDRNAITSDVKFKLTRTSQPVNYQGITADDTTTTQGVTTSRSVWGSNDHEIEVDANGHIVFSGLDAGTYVLTETATKAGFNKLTDTITVTINEDGNVTAKYTNGANIEVTAASKTSDTITPANFTIENRTGSLLPSTGGIGTTIFYVAGIALVIGAAVVLVNRKHKENA